MRLRGHHLLCTALFSGHGYSESFTQKMTELIRAMQNGERLSVFIGADEVCAACPNRTAEGGCVLSTEDVEKRDLAALRVLRLSPGEELTWAQAKSRLSLLTEQDFQAVCGGCRWQKEGLCSLLQLHRMMSGTRDEL